MRTSTLPDRAPALASATRPVVKAWAHAFSAGATVLDVGAEPGEPSTPAAQALIIEKVARALEPHGRFLFTAPRQPLEWLDCMTGRPSQSLGAETYERLLTEAGLACVAHAEDEGENHYYSAEKI